MATPSDSSPTYRGLMEDLEKQLEPMAKFCLDNQEMLSRLLNSQEWRVLLKLLDFHRERARRVLERSLLPRELYRAQGVLQVLRQVFSLPEDFKALVEKRRAVMESIANDLRTEVILDEELQALQRESAQHTSGWDPSSRDAAINAAGTSYPTGGNGGGKAD